MKSKESRNRKSKVPKEHKKPWQEAYATVGEIEAMLSERVLLRYNEVRGRTEIHWLSQGPVIGENEQGLLTIFIDLGFERRTFRNVRGYIVVRRSIAETESLRRELATPDTHTPDTPVF